MITLISKKYLKSLSARILISIIAFLLISIFINYSDKNLLFFKKHIYDNTFNFSKFNGVYKKIFGSPLPEPDAALVSGDKIIYDEIKPFHDGAELKGVDNIYPFKSGIVVFIGEKEIYGNTIIIQGMDGIDYWYSNIENISVKLYDYIESSNIIATSKDKTLYVLFMKNGEVLNFEEFF